jgi:hypothetical protein
MSYARYIVAIAAIWAVAIAAWVWVIRHTWNP